MGSEDIYVVSGRFKVATRGATAVAVADRINTRVGPDLSHRLEDTTWISGTSFGQRKSSSTSTNYFNSSVLPKGYSCCFSLVQKGPSTPGAAISGSGKTGGRNTEDVGEQVWKSPVEIW